jgi:hypothetical protein
MVKDSAEFNRLRSIFGLRPELSEEERTSMGKLHALIRTYNREVPELRLQIPDGNISLDLRICADYYFKCEDARLEEDAASKVAELLTSFLNQHPLEWRICYWKNDFIAELVLGELNTSLGARNEAGERWLKGYWKREQWMQRESSSRQQSAILRTSVSMIPVGIPLAWYPPDGPRRALVSASGSYRG